MGVGTPLQCRRGGGCVEIGRRLATGRRGRDENAAAASEPGGTPPPPPPRQRDV